MNNKITRLIQLSWVLLLVVTSNNLILAQQNAHADIKTLTGTEYVIDQQETKQNFNSKTYKDGNATITEIMDEYLFPASIDPTGKHIIIQQFGNTESSYYYSMETGILSFPGKGADITSDQMIGGDFLNESFPGGGGSTSTAGTYSLDTQEWTFLGLNPDYPDFNDDTYNSAWGLSDDGSTFVGLQMYNGWSAMAFKWTSEEGYTNIGSDLQYDSRASGISRNGETIFGWTSSAMGYWTPVVWHNDTYTILDANMSGEAMAASAEGTYVAGKVDENAFYWTEEDGITLFGSPEEYPTIIMEDGTAFGFTGVFPPPIRRAFYKNEADEILTFNDYAESRGMTNAQDWTFYSVNDVTPDGNKFIGAAINPDGQDVCFLIDFSEPAQTYELNLVASPEEGGNVSGSGNYTAGEAISISAEANPVWAFENWTDEDGNILSEDALTTITMPDATTTIYANFRSTVGIENVSNQTLNIRPNPASEQVYLQNISSGVLKVLNIQGQLIIEKQIDSDYVLNISDLNKGVYILSLESLNTNYKTTLIKQ